MEGLSEEDGNRVNDVKIGSSLVDTENGNYYHKRNYQFVPPLEFKDVISEAKKDSAEDSD